MVFTLTYRGWSYSDCLISSCWWIHFLLSDELHIVDFILWTWTVLQNTRWWDQCIKTIDGVQDPSNSSLQEKDYSIQKIVSVYDCSFTHIYVCKFLGSIKMIILVLIWLRKNHGFTFYEQKMEVKFGTKIFQFLEFWHFWKILHAFSGLWKDCFLSDNHN